MKKGEQLTIDQVISEWLKAEWYKSYYDSFREEFSSIVNTPDIDNAKENQTRKKLLESVRHDEIVPLLNLSLAWYCLTITSIEEYKNIFVIAAGDWYKISSGTFRAGEVPKNLSQDVVGHKEDIYKKAAFLASHRKFDERIIVVGSSEEQLTVIEGNHRMIASLLHMQKHNLSDFPQKIIAGFSKDIAKYRWSMQWEYIQDFLDLCKKEEESFAYRP